jgi:hypothetical protein
LCALMGQRKWAQTSCCTQRFLFFRCWWLA